MRLERPPLLLVSACLVGLPARYDGAVKINPELLDRIGPVCWVPICPEQLGGLATPREPCVLRGGDGRDVLAGRARLVNRLGVDQTEAFLKGARACLALAEKIGPRGVLFKSRSPSCGPVTRTGADGQPRPLGVTAALLIDSGFTVLEVDEAGLSDEVRRFIKGLS